MKKPISLIFLILTMLGLAAYPAAAHERHHGRGPHKGSVTTTTATTPPTARTPIIGQPPATNQPSGHNPPGNNGTVKIDGQPFEVHPNNEPHVGCVFNVDWFGFDDAVTSHVTFAVHPPTGSDVILTDDVKLQADDASGGGSIRGYDGSRTYDLSQVLASFTPHPKQGYHVKLTINTEGSIGADVKHKVFWVQGCQSSPPTTTSTTIVVTTTTLPPTTTTKPPVTSTTLLPPTSSTIVTTTSSTTTTVGRPPMLAHTGSSSGGAVFFALNCIGGGSALWLGSRRRRPAHIR